MLISYSSECGIIDPELLRVRDWRHKLQKALLCTEPIKEEVCCASYLVPFPPALTHFDRKCPFVMRFSNT